MSFRSIGAACAAASAALLVSSAAAGGECPTSQKPEQVYRVGVSNSSMSEVYRLNTGETRVVARFVDGSLLEQTFYQGLIRIENIDRGRRTAYKPSRDLADVFPLKVGKTYLVDFNVETPDGKKQVLHTKYEVTGKDQIFIGPCRYDVLKIAHSNSFGNGPLQFIDVDWYAPEIKATVAREYKSGNGQSVLRKYDAISVVENANGK